MACRAYEVSYNAEQVSTGAVKIVNERVQYCGADFRVDKGIARTCEKDINTKLLLVRCGDDLYDLLLQKDIKKTAKRIWKRDCDQIRFSTRHPGRKSFPEKYAGKWTKSSM